MVSAWAARSCGRCSSLPPAIARARGRASGWRCATTSPGCARAPSVPRLDARPRTSCSTCSCAAHRSRVISRGRRASIRQRTLAALWELFWAGLATPDTFSAIVAGAVPRGGGERAPAPAPPAPRSGAGVLGASAAGRALERARRGGAAVARRARRGARESPAGALRRASPASWLAATGRRCGTRCSGWSTAADVVRGYFVEGLSGEQYALAEALTDLAAPPRAERSLTCW